MHPAYNNYHIDGLSPRYSWILMNHVRILSRTRLQYWHTGKHTYKPIQDHNYVHSMIAWVHFIFIFI